MAKSPAQKILVNAGAVASGVSLGILLLIIYELFSGNWDKWGGRTIYSLVGILVWLLVVWFFVGNRPFALLLASALGSIGCLVLIYDLADGVFDLSPRQKNISQSTTFLKGCAPNEMRLVYFDPVSGREMWKVNLTTGVSAEDMTYSFHTLGPACRLSPRQLAKIRELIDNLPAPPWSWQGFLIGHSFSDEYHIAFYSGEVLRLYDYSGSKAELQDDQILQMLRRESGVR